MAGDGSTQRSPKNTDVLITDKNIPKTKHLSIDTNDSVPRSPRSSGGFTNASRLSVDSQRPKPPSPGTYLVQIPREQIYRVPPPENARRYEDLSRRKPNRSACRRCCCYSLTVLLVLVTLAAVLVGIFFLVFRPHKPMFSVSGVSVAGINLTSSTSLISSLVEVKVRSENVNEKLGLIYGGGSAAEIFYDGAKLGDGEFTAFDQPPENVTVTVTTLRGSRIQLTSSTLEDLKESEKKGKVPFDLRVKAPFKFKVSAVTMWTMAVTVDCKLTVDKLTSSATVITENCVTEGIILL
ncbi:NDR1/HIN1-like protein 13 [Brassica rapa]|uniref:NDR1/HIN1-like protein 13 n=1 Tax=Brassica campestris TaxID=3711 RepID=UPI00142D8DE7|nr:NDR1/HIN1-like protein 13 [Brassica rapa]